MTWIALLVGLLAVDGAVADDARKDAAVAFCKAMVKGDKRGTLKLLFERGASQTRQIEVWIAQANARKRLWQALKKRGSQLATDDLYSVDACDKLRSGPEPVARKDGWDVKSPVGTLTVRRVGKAWRVVLDGNNAAPECWFAEMAAALGRAAEAAEHALDQKQDPAVVRAAYLKAEQDAVSGPVRCGTPLPKGGPSTK